MQGILLLRRCIDAEKRYMMLVNEFVQERERIFAGLYPSYETKYGLIERETISTENATIYLIEIEDRIYREIKPLHRDRMLLQQALNTLNAKEKDIFNHLVWGGETSIEEREIKRLEQHITRRLADFMERYSVKGA